jgi:hypothetical protein
MYEMNHHALNKKGFTAVAIGRKQRSFDQQSSYFPTHPVLIVAAPSALQM